MTHQTFKLLEALACEGLTNELYGFVKDVRTKDYFGTATDIELQGYHMYVYFNVNDFYYTLGNYEPTHKLFLDEENYLMLFKLD